MSDVAMGRGAEFDLIRALRARWGGLAVGLGDDAAILDLPRGERLIATTDTAIERVHFRREWLSLEEVGYRAVMAALSDVAAMAAQPRGVLIAIAAPSDARDDVLAIGDGIGKAAQVAGTVILGGNLAHADTIVITTTALGSAYSPLTRSGARPGDLVYVTGALGGPAAALRSLTSGAPVAGRVRDRFAKPAARLAEGRWLAANGAVSAIDISDGLAADAGHLAAASACGIDLEMERIPLFPGVALEDAFGGEEYELLVTSRTPLATQEFAARFGITLTQVGRAVEGEPRVGLTDQDGNVAIPIGYDHFAG
jgi:thiamine-monophosphate kinase